MDVNYKDTCGQLRQLDREQIASELKGLEW